MMLGLYKIDVFQVQQNISIFVTNLQNYMTVKEVISQIEQQIAMPQAEDFDNVGLLCGRPDHNVSGILVCHDALENVVEEAIERNCNLIVCFHPIIFSGMKKITGKNFIKLKKIFDRFFL